MKFPNKITSYSESVVSKFPLVLKICEMAPITIIDLYVDTKDAFDGVNEYLDTLSCLYALNKINLDDETGRVFYVI